MKYTLRSAAIDEILSATRLGIEVCDDAVWLRKNPVPLCGGLETIFTNLYKISKREVKRLAKLRGIPLNNIRFNSNYVSFHINFEKMIRYEAYNRGGPFGAEMHRVKEILDALALNKVYVSFAYDSDRKVRFNVKLFHHKKQPYKYGAFAFCTVGTFVDITAGVIQDMVEVKAIMETVWDWWEAQMVTFEPLLQDPLDKLTTRTVTTLFEEVADGNNIGNQ